MDDGDTTIKPNIAVDVVGRAAANLARKMVHAGNMWVYKGQRQRWYARKGVQGENQRADMKLRSKMMRRRWLWYSPEEGAEADIIF
jgi:hypothetical protein